MSIESLNDDGTRNCTSSHQNDKSNVSAIGQVSKLVLRKQARKPSGESEVQQGMETAVRSRAYQPLLKQKQRSVIVL